METLRTPVLLAALFTTGCSSIHIDVLEPASSAKFDAQACVERALRRNPDPRDLPQAFAHFTDACDDGDAAGCSSLGVMYERGLGVTQDEARAAKLYQRACAAGNEAGCVHLGRAYATGRGVPPRVDKAMAFYSAACRGDHAPGCTALAQHYARGNGVMKSVRTAAPLFERACHKGDTDACYELGRMHEDGELHLDTMRTLVLYERACTGGVMAACEGVARVHDHHRPGVASPPEHPRREACEDGDAAACAAVGLAYYNGQGVMRDVDRAARFLERACDAGYEPGCTAIEPLLKGSCERGDQESCEALDRMTSAPRSASIR